MNPELRPVLLCIWLLSLFTFSAPGRDGPNDAGALDLIALAKVAVRGLSLLVVVWALSRADPVRRAWVAFTLLPWGLFLAWAATSVLWSALPAVTVGQTIGLAAQVGLMATLAALWRGPADTEAVLRHLILLFLTLSTIVLVVDMVRHDLSGLDRQAEVQLASNGIVHPTAAGATASLGLVLVLGCWLLWGWAWLRWLLLPGSVIHVAMMFLANSRMALGMAVAAVGLLVIGFTPRRHLAALALAGSVLGAGYLTLDPGLTVVKSAYQDGSRFIKRGESDETISSLTGRTALWEAIWASFLESPVVGHGYFVTSRTGLLDVWSGPANRSAHNIFLQVLVTTGLVGMGLFLVAVTVAVGRVVGGLIPSGDGADERGRVGGLLLVFGLWYLGWAQLAESFMGGVLPDAVLFFCLMGLGMGTVASPPAGVMVAAREVPR